MKKSLIFIVLVMIIGCQVCNCQKSTDYKAVYEKGTLKVYNNKDIVDKIKISASENYRIDQDSLHGLFFYAFYKDASVIPDYVGLCNKSDGEWIIKLNSNDNKDYMIPNISFMGSCHHNSYLLFEGGTDASVKEIKVITRKGDLNHSDNIYSSFKQPIWDESRMAFEYYKIADNYPDTLPEFTGNNNLWVRKYIWKRGKVEETDEYEQTEN